jgi:predicted RNase H-like nuclease (RuvC/YqgF family)
VTVERELTDVERELEGLRRERARLWEQLHDQRADQRELEHLREKVAMMEGSLSWRVTEPLRVAKLAWYRLRRLVASD